MKAALSEFAGVSANWPGDVLYVPAFAWHQVHNLSDNVGAGYRWFDVRQGLRTSLTQTAIVATATNPPPWRAYRYRELPELFDAHDY